MPTCWREQWAQATRAASVSALVVLASSPLVCVAGTASVSLEVSVSLVPEPPRRALCARRGGDGAQGAPVLVVCSTGAVVGVADSPDGLTDLIHGGVRRYLVPVSRGDRPLGLIDAQTTTGTILGWQLMQLPDREYIELTLGW